VSNLRKSESNLKRLRFSERSSGASDSQEDIANADGSIRFSKKPRMENDSEEEEDSNDVELLGDADASKSESFDTDDDVSFFDEFFI
jgi:hypothetical protein